MRLRTAAVITVVLGGALLVTGAVLVLVYSALTDRPFFDRRAFHYRTMNIDTQTMIAELSDPIPGRDPPPAEYYSTFRSMSFMSFDHYDGTRKLPYKVRYNYFEAALDKRLLMRSKRQELMRGAYGTVYANVSFYYGHRGGSSFDVRLNANKAEHEPLQLVNELPMPMPPLHAISVLRVFRSHPDYALARAQYDAHGKLKDATIFWSKGGDWHHDSDSKLSEERYALSTDPAALQEKFGIPDPFPIVNYLGREEWEWKNVDKPNPENVISLHYDYNRWVRQDIFDAAGKRTMRYLTYVVTPEDIMLEEIDRQVPFNERKTEQPRLAPSAEEECFP